MTTSSASEAISILIDMANQGEIDPWDVKVIDVIDRFLEEIGIFTNLDLAYQQRNLPRSGQAFLWASMLVRFKADSLGQISEPEPEAFLLEDALEETVGAYALPNRLENHLRRRTAAPPLRKRRVTLQELIEQIEQMAEELEVSTPARSTLKRPRSLSRKEAIQTITELAHQENLTEVAGLLDQFLRSHIAEFIDASDLPIELEDLLTVWAQYQQLQNPTDYVPVTEDHPHRDRVGLFWALLLLSSQSKVELTQEEFYQDLKVQII
jgi:segregation and condensation protein A